MNHQASGIGSDLELLRAQVQDLERRVSALEKEKQSAPGLTAQSKSTSHKDFQIDIKAPAPSESLVSILGKAVLGMAGAYFLRAAAESEFLPKLAVVVAALVYAGIWQFFSVRAGKNSRSAEITYGMTSALILFPMLWESTLRFGILPASVTALILFASVLSAMILEWRKASSATVWVVTALSSVTGLGLLVGTLDPFPFAVALILTAAIMELAACTGRWPGLRIVAEVPVNLALCALLYLAAQPGGFPSEYKPIRVSVLLVLFTAPVLVSAGAARYRSFRFRKQLTWAEICQTIISFALLCAAVLELGGSTETKTFGILCFLAAAACYFEAFLSDKESEASRDFRFHATCAGALFLIGSYFSLPASAVGLWLSLSAIASTALAKQTKGVTLAFHGFLWLVAGQISSGVMTYAGLVFVGSSPPAAPAMAWLLALSATICAVMVSLGKKEEYGIRLLRYVSVANTSFLLSAFAVAGLVAALPGGSSTSAPRLAFIRTFLICVVALVLALIGSRWKRREFILVAYTAIGLGTVKLLLEDWRFGSKGSFALSLLAFGVLLAVIPRLVRGGSRAKEHADAK